MNGRIHEIASLLNTRFGWGLQIDQSKMDSSDSTSSKAPIMLRILSIFGGLLGAILLALALNLIFQFTGLSNIIIGFLMLVGGVYIFQNIDNLVLDTMGLSFVFIGLGLFGFGLDSFFSSAYLLAIIYLVTGLALLVFTRAIILAFVGSVLSLSSLGYLLILEGNTITYIVFSLFLSGMMYYMINHEGEIIANYKQHTHKYTALLISISIALVVGAFAAKFVGFTLWYWTYGIPAYLGILYFAHRRNLPDMAYWALCILILPLVGSPGIISSIFVIVLAYHIQHKLALIVGVISLLYYVVEFYYNLHYTLLIKSILLMVSGALMMGAMWFIRNRFKSLNL
jgi:hypothetical protein